MERSKGRWIGLVGLVVLVAVLAGTGYWLVSEHVDVPLPESGQRTLPSLLGPDPFEFLPENVAQEVQADLGRLLNVEEAPDAIVALRQRVVELNRMKTPYTHAVIVVMIDGIARRFAKMDRTTKRACFYLLGEAFSWFEMNSAPTWPRLLAPGEEIVREQLATPEVANRVQALDFVRVSWDWLPAAEVDERGKELIAAWKTSLHEAAVELLEAPDERVREAAVRAVAASPVDEAAAEALVALEDPVPAVRRALLLALAERPTVLPSEKVLPLLNDPDYDVRTTARVVLSCRGVDSSTIELAAMAFHELPLARIQAVRHIAMSRTVDRVVWLGYLAQDEDPEVRAEALRALAFVGTPAAVRKLRELAAKEQDQAVRKLALELLAGLQPDPNVRPATHEQ